MFPSTLTEVEGPPRHRAREVSLLSKGGYAFFPQTGNFQEVMSAMSFVSLFLLCYSFCLLSLNYHAEKLTLKRYNLYEI